MTPTAPRRIDTHAILLVAIVALGMLLRGVGLYWDDGLYLHPDERFIAIVSSERIDLPPLDDIGALFDPATSPLNPRRDGPEGTPLSFAYGSLPLYVQSVASWFLNGFSERDFQSYREIYRVGRVLNVLIDTLTIVFVYLLARRLWSREAGLVAAALYALAVLPIQLSHFFTVDVWLTCFVTAALYLAIRFHDAPSLGRALTMAVPVGCAFATKASVPSLLAPLLLVGAVAVWRSGSRWRTAGWLLAAGLLALLIFTLFEPYALVRREPFIEDIRLQARIVRGQFDVPFTRQFVGLTPGLYELRNMFLFTLGPAFLLAALAGTAYTAARAWRLRSTALAVPVLWVAAYVPTLLITEARFLRYALPLVPVCAVMAGGMLVTLAMRRGALVPRVALAATLAITAIWGIGFTTVYSGTNPRIDASRWMAANVPRGSAITAETWDDSLPLPLREFLPLNYELIPSDVYSDEAPEAKARSIAETLQSADYVILSSDRVKDSVDNLPWRYAVQNEYYRRLLAGQLGFQLVYDGELRPELFGIRYDDSAADESFTVYDHPHVRIFRNVERLTSDEIVARLSWGIAQPWDPQRYPSQQPLMLREPVSAIETTEDAGWNGLAQRHPWIAIMLWVVALEIVGLAVLPLAALALGRTPDRGAFSARLLGLLLLGWVGWYAASLDFWPSRALTIVAALLAIAAGCWGGWWWRRGRGHAIALPSRRTWLLSSAGWLGLFAFFLLLRAIYPDFWQTWYGGEKPFELAYLRAVAASTHYPPYDPWYSGGTVNYYYYGWHLAATLAKLTGVGVSLAFQLSVASFAALLGLQAAALGGMLARRARAARWRVLAMPALASVALVLVVGNLDGLRQVGENLAARLRGEPPATFDFWRSTRVIDYTINEFPWFSAIWADLHPHVINLPIVLLLVTLLAALVSGALRLDRSALVASALLMALVLGTVAVTNAWDAPLMVAMVIAGWTVAGLRWSWRHALGGAAVGVGVAAGGWLLYAPFFIGFYSVVNGLGVTSAGSPLGQFLTVWGAFYLIVWLATLVTAVRRRHDARARADAVAFALLWLLAGLVALLANLVLGDGLPSGAALVTLALGTLVIAAGAAAAMPGGAPWPMLALVAGVTTAAALAVAWRPAASLALAFVALGLMLVARHRQAPRTWLPWAFVALGSVTIAAVEAVYVVDDLSGGPWERMNTVFKFSLPAWLLLAVASGVLHARLWQAARISLPRSAALSGIVAEGAAQRRPMAQPVTSSRLVAARAATAVAALVVLATLIYPVAGTPVRLSWDMPSSPDGLTLDGYAWMEGGEIANGTGETLQFTGDLRAIEWLEDNVRGTPVILEASIGPYRGNGGRVSSATGLPTVLGWDRHQRQQRYAPGIDQRMADVRAIYNATDPAEKLALLRQYDVRYVVVGDVERLWNVPENPQHYASAEGLAAFDTMVGSDLSLVFDAGTTRIYEVHDFPRLAPAAGAEREL